MRTGGELRKHPRLGTAVLLPALLLLATILQGEELRLPVEPGSVRFAAIGDMGTGDSAQYDVAARMVETRRRFPFEFVIMLGDNIYGGGTPKHYQQRFERPYKLLLDDGVTFHAALGNHDNLNERLYQPFNMNGTSYYAFQKSNVRFFVLNSNYLEAKQLAWLEAELKNAGSDDWKICYFHHPLYSSARMHGPATDLRLILEPLFIKYGVDAVFSGHEHVYQRIQPGNGITYFVEGASGQLRRGNLKTSDASLLGYDKDHTFMLVEVARDELHFQTITRTGLTVDSGVLRRRGAATPSATPTATPVASPVQAAAP